MDSRTVLVNTRRPVISYEPSTPPAEIVETLNGFSPDQLQHVARYAEEPAECKAHKARLEEESDRTHTPLSMCLEAIPSTGSRR